MERTLYGRNKGIDMKYNSGEPDSNGWDGQTFVPVRELDT